MEETRDILDDLDRSNQMTFGGHVLAARAAAEIRRLREDDVTAEEWQLAYNSAMSSAEEFRVENERLRADLHEANVNALFFSQESAARSKEIERLESELATANSLNRGKPSGIDWDMDEQA